MVKSIHADSMEGRAVREALTMKIGDMLKTSRNVRADRKPGVTASASTQTGRSSPPESATNVTLAGIPEAELTPKVREALFGLMNEVQALRGELAETRARADELEKLADRDPLLDIMNRRAFVRELDRTMAMIERHDMRASLVFLDLNGLKIINDSNGHSAGDAALTHVAQVLSAHSRQTDVVGRLGGDEFGLLLAHADKVIATKKAEDLAALVAAEPAPWDGGAFSVSVSIGVAEINKGASIEQAMEEADSAMYNAKRSGVVTR